MAGRRRVSVASGLAAANQLTCVREGSDAGPTHHCRRKEAERKALECERPSAERRLAKVVKTICRRDRRDAGVCIELTRDDDR